MLKGLTLAVDRCTRKLHLKETPIKSLRISNVVANLGMLVAMQNRVSEPALLEIEVLLKELRKLLHLVIGESAVDCEVGPLDLQLFECLLIFATHIFCLTFKMSHDRGWREPCGSEHGS